MYLTKLAPAISEGYSRRVQEKKENSINIYNYIKRTILEARGLAHFLYPILI